MKLPSSKQMHKEVCCVGCVHAAVSTRQVRLLPLYGRGSILRQIWLVYKDTSACERVDMNSGYHCGK